MNSTQLILPVMITAGVLGGVVNCHLADPSLEKPLAWWQHVVVGVAAAFIVPVFLNTISSNLLSDIKGDVADAAVLTKLLVLAGFCLLAAISSRAFIRTLTDRLLSEVSTAKKIAKEAKEQAAEAEAIAQLTVEADDEPKPTVDERQKTVKVAPPPIEQNERSVLRAMVNSRFSMRSITGLAKETGLSNEMVSSVISDLATKGLAEQGKSKEGQPRWYPTALGRIAERENTPQRQ